MSGKVSPLRTANGSTHRIHSLPYLSVPAPAQQRKKPKLVTWIITSPHTGNLHPGKLYSGKPPHPKLTYIDLSPNQFFTFLIWAELTPAWVLPSK